MNKPRHPSRPPTILVVDDTSLCREAVADILRLRGFNVFCASDGKQALEMVKSRSPDLIILDVVMPGMDGIRVLSALRKDPRWRGLPVILLTDHAERDLVRAAVNLGVKSYLLKSAFTPSELLERVERYVKVRAPGHTKASPDQALRNPTLQASAPASVRATVAPGAVDETRTPTTGPSCAPTPPAAGPDRKTRRAEVLSRIRHTLTLRPVPPVLHYVVSQTNAAGSSIQDVADTIRQDQALALRIMRIANSSFYATGKRARTLVEAAGRLGMSGIRNAVVAVVGIDHFAGAAETGLVPQRFWEHSLGVAALAKGLAESFAREDAEEVFLAALLHDIGRLVLAESFPEEYRQLLSEVRNAQTSLSHLEFTTFGISHAEATREILVQLGFPEEIVSTASLHQRSPAQISAAERDPRPALIVALADRLAHALLLGSSGDAILCPTQGFLEALKLDIAALAEIGRDTVRKISDMQTFYASRGGEEFLSPLATEIARRAPGQPRIAVLSRHAPNDVLSQFFEQLGWLDNDQPGAVAMIARSQAELEACWSELNERIHAGAEPVSVLVAQDESDVQIPDHVGSCPVQMLQLPAPYDELVLWAARSSSAAASAPSAR